MHTKHHRCRQPKTPVDTARACARKRHVATSQRSCSWWYLLRTQASALARQTPAISTTPVTIPLDMYGRQAYLDNDGTSRNQELPFEERREEDGATTAGEATAEGPVLNEQLPRVVPGDLHAAAGLGASARNRRGRAAPRNTGQAQAGGHVALDSSGYVNVINTVLFAVCTGSRRTGGEGSASRGGYVHRWHLVYAPDESRTFHHPERHSPEPPITSEAARQLREFVRAAVRTWPIEE